MMRKVLYDGNDDDNDDYIHNDDDVKDMFLYTWWCGIVAPKQDIEHHWVLALSN